MGLEAIVAKVARIDKEGAVKEVGYSCSKIQSKQGKEISAATEVTTVKKEMAELEMVAETEVSTTTSVTAVKEEMVQEADCIITKESSQVMEDTTSMMKAIDEMEVAVVMECSSSQVELQSSTDTAEKAPVSPSSVDGNCEPEPATDPDQPTNADETSAEQDRRPEDQEIEACDREEEKIFGSVKGNVTLRKSLRSMRKSLSRSFRRRSRMPTTASDTNDQAEVALINDQAEIAVDDEVFSTPEVTEEGKDNDAVTEQVLKEDTLECIPATGIEESLSSVEIVELANSKDVEEAKTEFVQEEVAEERSDETKEVVVRKSFRSIRKSLSRSFRRRNKPTNSGDEDKDSSATKGDAEVEKEIHSSATIEATEEQSDAQPSLEEEKGEELMDDVPKDVDQDVQKVGDLNSGDGVINVVAEDTLQSDVNNLEQCKEENPAPTDVTDICESAEEGEEAIALQNHLDNAAATEEPISAEEPPKHRKRSSLGKALHSAKKRLSMPFHSHQVPLSIEASVGEESTKMSLSTTNEETDYTISEVPNNLVGVEEKNMSLVNEQGETDQSNQLNDEQLQLIGLSDEVQGKEDMTLTDQVKVEEVEVQKEEPQDTETITEDATCPDESSNKKKTIVPKSLHSLKRKISKSINGFKSPKEVSP